MLALAGIGLCFAYSTACLACGSIALRALGIGSRRAGAVSELALAATSFLLGQGILAAAWLGLGLAGAFSPGVVIGVLGASILAGGRLVLRRSRGAFREIAGSLSNLQRIPVLLKLVVVGLLLLVLFEGAVALLTPPRGDSVAFYMALSKVMAASHRLVPLPGYAAFTQIGLQGELHYAALMALGSPQGAKMFVWPTGLAAALLLVSIGTTIGLRAAGKWIAVTIFFTGTATVYLLTTGAIGLFAAAMGLAAAYWALQTDGAQRLTPVLLAGGFCGLAVVAKLPYLAALLPAVCLLVFWRWALSQKGRRPSQVLASGLAMIGTFAISFALPWIPQLVKNGLLFGEPLAPLIVGGGQSFLSQTWFSPGITRRIVLSYPLALTFGAYPMQGGTMSPLLLAFAPLVLLVSRAKKFLRNPVVQVAASGVVGVIAWVVVRPSVLAPRYILAVILLLIPVAALGAERALAIRTRMGTVVRVVVLLSCLTTLAAAFAYQQYLGHMAWQQVVDGTSCCAAHEEGCRAAGAVNGDAAAGDRVYLMGYYRYWLRADLLQCISRAADGSPASLPTSRERWEQLFDRGFAYVMIDNTSHQAEADLLDPADTPSWLRVTLLFEEAEYTVLRLESTDSERRPSLCCRQETPPAWDVVEQ
jgi:hypothetical protein